MPDDMPLQDLTDQTIADFHILRKLGQGGMGQVYLARQLSLKRDVALKILKSELASNPTALQRFRLEAEAVARISHPNIVQVFAVGEQKGLHYMALEYVEGRNLREYLSRKGPPELPVSLSIIRQVASALQRANELGLVHRDIKPENILITRKANVKVADFGLSRFFAGETPAVHLTQSGVTLGTPLYMSPEQVRGETTDHRSDLYSLGVTAYHLLAGEPPFQGKTPFEVSLQHVQSVPPPLSGFRPDLPAELCTLIHRMMAKSRDDRYQTARDVIRDLSKIRDSLANGTIGQFTGELPIATTAQSIGSLSNSFSSPSRPSGKTLILEPMESSRPISWQRFLVIGLIACGVFAVSYGGVRYWPARSPAAIRHATDKPGEPIVSTAELDLKSKIESRSTPADDVLAAAIELGLMYVKERRWADADRLFGKMEADELYRGQRPLEFAFVAAGKLGHGVSLSHQDQSKKSNDLIFDGITQAAKIRTVIDAVQAKGNRPLAMAASQQFFLRHPSLSEAVAEAVTRNGENKERDVRLDWLKTPGSLMRGP
jgi:eukaryotic-like serine/threonine-protein kinase